jgi:hypothetical protein
VSYNRCLVQVLYPRFPVRALSANKQDTSTAATSTSNGTNGSNGSNGASGQDVSAKAEAAAQQQNGGNHNEDEAPDDERVVEVLRRVRLGHLLYRYDPRSTTNGNGNGSVSSAGSEAGSISDAGEAEGGFRYSCRQGQVTPLLLRCHLPSSASCRSWSACYHHEHKRMTGRGSGSVVSLEGCLISNCCRHVSLAPCTCVPTVQGPQPQPQALLFPPPALHPAPPALQGSTQPLMPR